MTTRESINILKSMPLEKGVCCICEEEHEKIQYLDHRYRVGLCANCAAAVAFVVAGEK